MDVRKIIIMFILYSIIGWIGEMIYCYIYDRSFVNRGFLNGPVCPIYGCGALFIVFMVKQYQNNILLVFLFGLIGCSVLEYITSYLMEKVFHAKWWDYSKHKFNINGRVCLLNSIIFGIGSVIIIYLIQPMVMLFINGFDDLELTILAISLLVYFVFDYLFSFIITLKYKNIRDKKEEVKDEFLYQYFNNKIIKY